MNPNESRAFLSSASRKATEQAPEKSQVYSSDAVVYPYIKGVKKNGPMGVSKNRGTPKWMVYNGKPYFSHNHGSGSGRGPFSTSMIMGGRFFVQLSDM